MIYTWRIEDLIKKPSVDGLSEVVTHVPFVCTGTDDNGASHDYYHLVKLPAPSSESFIDFNLLTEDQVIEWVKANVDTELVYSVIAERINMSQGDGTTLPWGNTNHHTGGN